MLIMIALVISLSENKGVHRTGHIQATELIVWAFCLESFILHFYYKIFRGIYSERRERKPGLARQCNYIVAEFTTSYCQLFQRLQNRSGFYSLSPAPDSG